MSTVYESIDVHWAGEDIGVAKRFSLARRETWYESEGIRRRFILWEKKLFCRPTYFLFRRLLFPFPKVWFYSRIPILLYTYLLITRTYIHTYRNTWRCSLRDVELHIPMDHYLNSGSESRRKLNEVSERVYVRVAGSSRYMYIIKTKVCLYVCSCAV